MLDSLVKESLKREIKSGKKQATVNILFSQCTVALKDENHVRIANALMTLCVISRSILFKKKKTGQNYDAIDSLIGSQDLDIKIEVEFKSSHGISIT